MAESSLKITWVQGEVGVGRDIPSQALSMCFGCWPQPWHLCDNCSQQSLLQASLSSGVPQVGELQGLESSIPGTTARLGWPVGLHAVRLT